jgi:MFS family permease
MVKESGDSMALAGRSPTLGRNFGLILGVSILWLPLSMLFNSLQSLVLPAVVLGFVGQAHKGTVLGLILFVGLAAGALIQPLAGVYSDRLSAWRKAPAARWGRRQPVIVVGTLLTVAFLAGFALASNIGILAVSYVGVSITAGIAQAGFQGLLPDFVPANLRGRAAGLKGFLELLGSLLGFSIAGVLIKQRHPAGVLLAISILLVIGALLSLVLVREGQRLRSHAPNPAGADVVPPAGPVTTLAQQSSQERLPAPVAAGAHGVRTIFARVMLCRFLFLLGAYGIGHFLLFYIHDRLHVANPAGLTSMLLTIFTLESALVALSGGALSDRMGRLPLLWVAAGLSVLGALLLIPATGVALILIGGSVMSIGSGLFASANWALTADLTPTGAGGRFFGLLALATGGAAALAGLFGPLVDLPTGYNPLFVVAALTFAGSAVVLPRAAQIARAVSAVSVATA